MVFVVLETAMLITYWTYALIALFNWQYSYDVKHLPMDVSHIQVINGSLVTCIYPSDRSFKKGSKTLPRSELRSLYEAPGSFPYTFEVNVSSVPKGTDYSVWQVFGDGSPLLMLRHRQGVKQMVVFDGQPKIQQIADWPTSCTVDCPGKKVFCNVKKESGAGATGGVETVALVVSSGNLKCSKMYFKVGVYAQGRKPSEKMCIVYEGVKYFSL